MAASSLTRGLWDTGSGSLIGPGGQTDRPWWPALGMRGRAGPRAPGSPSELGNSRLLTALGMRVCALNEELGLALISQQGMAQPAVFSLPQAHGAGLRTYEPAQHFWATVAGAPAHFPVSLRSPPHYVASVWRLAEGMGDGADNQGGLLLQGLPCPI